MTTVLLVEDDPDHRELFARILTVYGGHLVHTAADAASAMALTARHRIDAAVLDVHLPTVNGIQVCQLLRTQPPTQDLPIVLLSADASPATMRAALWAGADDFLTKPLPRARLVARVSALLPSAHRVGINPALASLLAAGIDYRRATADRVRVRGVAWCGGGRVVSRLDRPRGLPRRAEAVD